MNLDAVQMNSFSVDQCMMPDPTDSMLEDPSMSYEVANSYDELFPSLPENDLRPELPNPDLGQWNQKMKLKTSVITQVFRVPVEERKFHDMNSQRFGEQGEQAKICSDIMQKTGAHIEISSSKDQSLTILVTGKEDAVLRARRFISKELQTQASVSVAIPREHHRFILGKSGKTLQELERSTATKISVPRPDQNSDSIKIVGTKEGIEKARHEIQIMSDEQAKLAFERLNIPKIYHPFILGPNGQTMHQIMAETGARINIPPPSVMKDELTIAGEKESVAMAKDRILHIFDDKKKNCQVVSVEVPKNQHKHIIGNRGLTIQEILRDTGVSVEIPSVDVQSDTITLRGEQDKLGPALTLVYAKANSVKTVHVEAPSWLHKYIIGKKGANIQQITQDSDVHVEFEDGQDRIEVEGTPQEVGECCKKLKDTIKDLLNRLTYQEISVDPRHHRHIIGKNGVNIKKIKQDIDVQIHIPTDDTKIIRIEGSHEGVAKAKKELLEMVNKMESEVQKELKLDQCFHRTIIGARGEKIREIRDRFNQVVITFPEQGKRSDKVILRGPPADVNACAQYLNEVHAELKSSNYVAEVPINKQNHKFIIGRGGSYIKKIRDETGAKIDLPSEGSDSDVIQIRGRKEDVMAAQDMLLDKQKQLDNVITSEIMIPAKLHNSIIGSKGRSIRSISDECGSVTIRFPPENCGSDKVSICGIKDDVQKAKKILLELSNEKQATGYTEEIKAKPEQHKFLIGKNGANIKKLREKTGARVIFPNQNTDSDRDTITIIGRKEDVLAAKTELLASIAELDDTTECQISVDPKYHRHFVSRGAEVVRKIGDEFGGVSVSFPRVNSNSSTVILKGQKNCIDGAKLKIMEIVKELEQMITTECMIPQEYHRTVMGQKGWKVQNIQQTHSVQIKFPDKDLRKGNYNDSEYDELAVNGDYNGDADSSGMRKCDIVMITGKKENCEAAKKALEDLIPVTEEVDVPYDLHRFIIGQKGKDVRSMMETYDVNITIPPQEEESNMIKITGSPSSVKNAKTAMLDKMEALEAEKQDRQLRSFQVTFEVDSQYHSKIIGRKGEVINKIKNEHQVKINFPDRESQEESNITIVGYEQNAEAAKVAILKIVQEQEEMYHEEVQIDPRVHSRIIGTRGRNITKIMNDFHVDIRFPRGTSTNPDIVVISGSEESVLDVKDKLLNLEEECLQDIREQELMRVYTQPPSRHHVGDHDFTRKPTEFVVTGAPWDKTRAAPDTTNVEEFPSFGSAADAPSKPVAWGPSRR